MGPLRRPGSGLPRRGPASGHPLPVRGGGRDLRLGPLGGRRPRPRPLRRLGAGSRGDGPPRLQPRGGGGVRSPPARLRRNAMTKLQQLHEEFDQSPWLDNLRRGWITGGELQSWVDRRIRGITSNPSIFQKAIGTGTDYDAQLRELHGGEIGDVYWSLVVQDIEDALRILRPVHDSSDGVDGYVSVEVAPALARDTERTIAAARELHERIAEPNLYVKIPATAEGIPAIQQMISEGRSTNITLIFSLDRYQEVMEAYIAGL